MRLLGEAEDRLRHPVQKEALGRISTAMPVGGRDQLVRLGNRQRGKEVRIDRPYRTAQPDIEEVGEISITDVVVVGRVGRNDFVLTG